MSELTISLDEVPEGGSIRRNLGEREIAIYRKGDEIYAIDASCPHRHGPLDEADIEDEYIVVCPWHGWRFDLRTGLSPTHPARVNCYETTVADGQVTIRRGG